jgi:hypothetical protein
MIVNRLSHEAHRNVFAYLKKHRKQFKEEGWSVADIVDSINANEPWLAGGKTLTDWHVRSMGHALGFVLKRKERQPKATLELVSVNGAHPSVAKLDRILSELRDIKALLEAMTQAKDLSASRRARQPVQAQFH